MPPPKKELSPVSRAKADKRNARLQEKRAADAAASGGAKSGKKKAKMTDLTEEEMPVSGGGSSCTWKRSGELLFALLEEKQKRHFEAGELELAEENATFYERPLGLQDAYVKFLEWSDAEKAKKIEVLGKEKEELKKQYQDVLDDNKKDFEWMHQEVNKNQNEFLTCWEHHLDLLHLCNGKFMDNREPINHTKLLHNNGYNFKDFVCDSL